MINILITILILIVMLSVIISIHEFGHFITAKKNGIFVDEFSLGMGPVILKHKPKNNPPIIPSTVLFGEISGANLYLPILVPKKWANVSAIIVISNT